MALIVIPLLIPGVVVLLVYAASRAAKKWGATVLWFIRRPLTSWALLALLPSICGVLGGRGTLRTMDEPMLRERLFKESAGSSSVSTSDFPGNEVPRCSRLEQSCTDNHVIALLQTRRPIIDS